MNVPSALKPTSPGRLMPTPIVVLEPAVYVIFILPSTIREYRPPTLTHLGPNSRTFLAAGSQIGPGPLWGTAGTADFGSASMCMLASTGPVLALPSTATRARPPCATFRAKLKAPTATLLRARTSRLWIPWGRATLEWIA